MADQRYRLRDVPKAERWSYFWEYYKLHVIVGLAVVISVGYLLYGIFGPKADLTVMWLSGSYSLEEESAIRNTLEHTDWDTNGDGRTKVLLTYLDFDKPYEELSYQTMSEINTLIAGQQYSFFLVNSLAFDWMDENGILGSWRDAGIDRDGRLAVPLTDLPAFPGDAGGAFTDLRLVISAPDTGRNDDAEYTRQNAALVRYLTGQGILP